MSLYLRRHFWIFTIAGIIPATAFSFTTEVGINVFQRLAGVPPTAAQMSQIDKLSAGGKLREISDMAMAMPSFYRSTVKHMATPMSNLARLASGDLNDVSATIVGMVRDDVPLNKMLYDDILYIGDTAAIPASVSSNIPPPRDSVNDHFRQLDVAGVDLSNKSYFKQVKASSVYNIPAEATMGINTLRTAADAFMKNGTNRRMVRGIVMNFFCRDMEQLHDNTLPDYRIRQDVTRTPGGDAMTFVNKCVGCHAGMDALAGAFAFYDFVGTRGNDGVVANYRVNYGFVPFYKMLQHSDQYPNGYQTVDDGWVNLWTDGQNSSLGFRESEGVPTTQGFGAKSLGMMFSATKAFSSCMAKRAYSEVCARQDPYSPAEEAAFVTVGESFETSNYNGKTLFAESVKLCVGDQL